MNKFVLFGFVFAACDPLPPSAVTLVAPLPTPQPDAVHTCADADVRTDCNDVQRACTQRGFYANGWSEGHGIKYDCLDVLLRGDSVQGVNVPNDELTCIRFEATRIGARGADAENDFENQCIYASGALANADAAKQKRSACDAIDEACARAGYYFGGATQGLGIQLNCLTPLFHGQGVRGLRVDRLAVQACFGVTLNDDAGFNMAMDDAPRIAPGP